MNEINRITIELIEHSKQRYDTVGDWFLDPSDPAHLIIRGSNLPTKLGGNYGWLKWAVPLHELCEALASMSHGVGPDAVDDFDFKFEAAHPGWQCDEEPGDDPSCPYHFAHEFALWVERRFVSEMLGQDWDQYEDALDRLMKSKSKPIKKPKPRSKPKKEISA